MGAATCRFAAQKAPDSPAAIYYTTRMWRSCEESLAECRRMGRGTGFLSYIWDLALLSPLGGVFGEAQSWYTLAVNTLQYGGDFSL